MNELDLNSFDTIIKYKIKDAKEILRKDILQKTSELSINGIFDSTIAINLFRDMCISSLKYRFEIALTEFESLLSNTNITPTDSDIQEALSIIERYIKPALHEFRLIIHDNFSSSFPTEANMSFDKKYDEDFERTCAQIKLCVQASKKKKDDTKTTKSESIIIQNSYVGSLQTGDYSTSTVVQNISQEIKSELVVALDKISDYLSEGNSIPNMTREEIEFNLNKSKEELTKPQPNSGRLTNFLLPIAMSIQTISVLSDAYNVLKFSLGFFGITLP